MGWRLAANPFVRSEAAQTGCAPGFNLVQNGGPMANGNGSVGDGGGYGAIYCLALSE